MRRQIRLVSVLALALGAGFLSAAASAETPLKLLQQPSLSRDLIAFTYAGDLWTAPRTGGRATRLTTGVGVEANPVFSPDGQTLAFTGDYDGNTDVFTVPVTGGAPTRITWHPANDQVVGWSRDGRSILFRSDRSAASRYTQLFTVSAHGGPATPLPLPMAYAGSLSPDGGSIAYTPLAPAFGSNFTNYVAWGNYRGGRAGVVKITRLSDLSTVEAPHGEAADFSPVYVGDTVYFLSGRNGPVGVFAFDPASGKVREVYHNTGPDIRSLATDGKTLVFDRLGEIYTLDPAAPGAQPAKVEITADGDLPDVRPRLLNVADQVKTVALSPSGVRVAVEAHGEILTVPVKHGPVRDITHTPGVSERTPAWSPDGQSIAYFSDASGVYALHVASQLGASATGPNAVKVFPISPDAAYYFDPVWSPDSRKISFRDNRLNSFVLDVTTGKLTRVGEPQTFGGFSAANYGVAWSPDSRWLVLTSSLPNRMHGLSLYSLETGSLTPLTDGMADAGSPAFDRTGESLYFLASNNAGGALPGIDMTTDVYAPTSSAYALPLTAARLSPVGPQTDDEKVGGAPADGADAPGHAKDKAGADKEAAKSKSAKAGPVAIDLAGLDLQAILDRTVALPLPPRPYAALATGVGGTLFLLENERGRALDAPPLGVLSRFTLKDRKPEKVAEHVAAFQVSADGESLLLEERPEAGPGGPGGGPPGWSVIPANGPAKPGEGKLSFAGLEVRVDPRAEWRQMFHEIWRIERAYFYDPHFHGVDTVAEEKRLAPYVDSIQARVDLNYLFQEMLTGFSVGHLRGSGGAIPAARKVPGGLLGADYEVRGGRYCITRIYTGGSWTPDVKGPLSQPGLNVRTGECVLAVNGEPVTAEADLQASLEGTAGKAISLTLGAADGKGARDITVVPVASEARLRNLDWIDGNRRKVAALSGGKLAYVYLPDTAGGGFTSFNRYFFAQTDKQGVVVDERFNAGGQIADYVVEVLGRKPQSYWSPRYGAIDRTPGGAIFGPKVMIANEVSGSGGDALPWLFKFNHLGPVVGKRTWGGLVGIGQIPVLMDGGNVTSPSVAFFNPDGQWDVENHGVDPDIVVEQDPKAVAEGHDPQLEAAVRAAMSQLPTQTPKAPPRPAYPDYHKPAGK